MAWYDPVWRWLVGAAVGGLVVLGVGTLAALACRQPVRRLRLLEWTLIATLLVPWVGWLPGLPRWSLGFVPRVRAVPQASPLLPAPKTSTPAPPVFEPWPREIAPTVGAEPARGPVALTSPARPPAHRRPVPTPREARLAGWSDWLRCGVVVAYLAGVVVLTVRWLVGTWALRRLGRTARAAPEAVRARLRELAGPPSDGVRLLVSARTLHPVTFGCLQPVIVLPEALAADPDAVALRYALAHEWSHVERHDARTWCLATLGEVVSWYQPLFWWLRRQIRLCQDYVADARAADQAAAPEDYADYLVQLAARLVRGRLGAGLGLGDRRSHLFRRVIMLVQNTVSIERRCPRRWSLATALGALAVLVAVSSVRLRAADPPTAPERKAAGDAREAPRAAVEGPEGSQKDAPDRSASKPEADRKARGQAADNAPVKVRTVTVKRGTFREYAPVMGTVESSQRVELYPRVTGTVMTQSVDLGDRVKKGQVLATIAAPEIELELRRCEAAVQQAKARLVGARAAVLAAQASLAAARVMQRRAADQERREASDDHRAEREAAAAALNVAEAKVQTARSDVQVTDADVEIANVALDKQKALMEDTRVRAPLDGIVTALSCHIGDFVRGPGQAGQPLFVIDRVDPVRIVADLPSAWINRVRVGTPAKFRPAQHKGKSFEGTVSRTSYAIDLKTGTFRVQMDLPPSEPPLRPGQVGTFSVLHPNVLLVPQDCLFMDGGVHTCYRVVDGRMKRTGLEVGLFDDNDIAVLEGLQEGDRVVVGEVNGVEDPTVLITPDHKVIREGQYVQPVSDSE